MLAFIAVRSEQPPGDDSVSHALAQCPEVRSGIGREAGDSIPPRGQYGFDRVGDAGMRCGASLAFAQEHHDRWKP